MSKKQIEPLLKAVREKKASDLLLTVGAAPQLRINGLLEPEDDAPLSAKQLESMVLEILSEHQKLVFETYKSVDFSIDFPSISKFRMNAYYQRGNVALAARIIPDEIPSAQELGLPKIIEEFSGRSSGLFLVTGPAGSGKSTTLASMVDRINRHRSAHIITIEDPIEYEHHHIRSIVDQREIGSDAESFSSALHSIFRQSPDVIMVGELRDLETIHLALTLAETGHLILGTLHTQDTTHAISRIVDVFPSDQQQQIYFQVSQVLIGVVAQQLMLTQDNSKRVLACEVMRVNSGIQNLIREMKIEQIYSMIQAGRKEGMVTMNESLRELLELDLVHAHAALNRTVKPRELLRLIEAHKQ
ncbi:type IV pilus twitching motility protein PilT [Tichowtungia aerotolerans]|uniref:PilT/PilU family type 4a pilus ATPase n=1 Tax=Tichowtungia aerotolerans TaxID=2697043 RepID=A0A6P1MHF4_9BACT|nr:PilT/PilU family type 4a pilus ATPase [Tichowtungia aerotolerans]QHI70505.1 PilT/PilU family type 4a pilus ATPase [Tichowtungia aerotolerans]